MYISMFSKPYCKELCRAWIGVHIFQAVMNIYKYRNWPPRDALIIEMSEISHLQKFNQI